MTYGWRKTREKEERFLRKTREKGERFLRKLERGTGERVWRCTASQHFKK